ncbi:hypothetical protein GE061_010456 [Apolygus lucorum]|uniref:BLOC-2 complex member HPS3 N-terminal domain-containing protein n=1 Tax=Apolygus lucorum TaxID=248454 RepID=A0A8S9XWV7_APOLU|nr:hypothetical protein GE061_010456 [Apolygus lucorum]
MLRSDVRWSKVRMRFVITRATSMCILGLQEEAIAKNGFVDGSAPYGNYVATMEKKQTRQGKEVTYARVYTNWDKRPESDSEQAMRARIAGRVTPSSSQTGADILEMIELPVRFPNVTTMACCQETGNVLIGSDNIICLFQLVTRTHDISKQKFLDFELWPVTLELSFSPSHLVMSEDVVASLNSSCLHVFRINKGFARPTDWSSASASNSPRKTFKPKKPSPPNSVSRGVTLPCEDDIETSSQQEIEEDAFAESRGTLKRVHELSTQKTTHHKDM